MTEDEWDAVRFAKLARMDAHRWHRYALRTAREHRRVALGQDPEGLWPGRRWPSRHAEVAYWLGVAARARRALVEAPR